MKDKRKGWIKDGVGYIPLTKGQICKVDPKKYFGEFACLK